MPFWTPSTRFDRARPARGVLGFAAALVVIMAVAAIVQFLVGALAPFIAEDLDTTRAELGLLTSVLFTSAAVLSPVAGPLVDRLGAGVMVVTLLVASVATLLLMAAAPAVGWLLVAMVVGGVGIAVMNPVTNLLIAERLPAGRRGVVTGVKQSGVLAGSALAGVGAAPLAAWVGWRSALVILAVVTLLLAAAAVRAVRGRVVPDERAAPSVAPGAVPTVRVGWLSAYALAMGAAASSFGAFLVIYAVESLDFAPSTAGAAFGFGSAVGVVARVWWGRATERRQRVAPALLLLAVLATLGQAAIWAAQLQGALLWIGALLFGCSAMSWNAVGMLAVIRGAPNGRTGRASGIVQAAFYGGFIVAPVLFGAAVDHTDGYDLAWAGTTAMFALAAVIAGVHVVLERRDAVALEHDAP
ncbi:MFS transporter [Egibacter rhizosphaerae]|uniref:MFS transporter n=1 Tax=Egibacter rhizosphaerae TaxID=1670831 RepID=A0A411YEJ1_9ACTN|nr:MFS transporter [Egibacter rhizosphaerae]QBI19542.1 MFS transporter [Egibacter rhizosphaerae]